MLISGVICECKIPHGALVMAIKTIPNLDSIAWTNLYIMFNALCLPNILYGCRLTLWSIMLKTVKPTLKILQYSQWFTYYKSLKTLLSGQQRYIFQGRHEKNTLYKVLAVVKILHAKINNIWHYFIIQRNLLRYLF